MPNIYYYCVLDFEATCWEGERRPSQEIIEFPSVLIRVDKFRKIENIYKSSLVVTLCSFSIEP